MSKGLLSGIKNVVVVLIILALLLPVVSAVDTSLGQVGTMTLSFQQPPAGTVSVGDTVLLNVQASGYDLVAKPVARVGIDKLVYDTTKLRFLGLRNGDNSEMCGGTAMKCILPPPAYFQFMNPDGRLPLTWYPMSVVNPLFNNVLRITTSSTTADPADYFSRGQHTLFILAFEAIADGQATVSVDPNTLIKLRPSLQEYYTPARVVPASIAIAAACGNGRHEPGKGEECDDGNQNNNDACTTACELNVCGDGLVYYGPDGRPETRDQGEEQCDGQPGCTRACQWDRDTDGVIDDVDNCPFGDGDKILNEAGVDNNADQTNTDNPTNDLALENPLQGDVCDADDDNDLLDDAVEAVLGTNPLVTDTDGDGLGDKLENDTGTKPLEPDTDSDGLTDAIEDTNLNGAKDAGETDPRVADTDGDSIGDAIETDNGQRIDTDRDGTIDALDVDSDNDSVDDQIERAVDTDGDGIPDYRDEDSDNDGLSDGFEESRFFDGIEHDYVTLTNRLSPDTDGDGLCDGPVPIPEIVNCQGSEDKNANGVFERQGIDLLDRTPDDETNPLVADTDEDGFCDGPVIPAGGECKLTNNQPDTCPAIANADQLDTDRDATEGCNVAGFCGDACDTDDDNDNVIDGEDNCPLVPNPTDANGPQLDTDNDRQGDACDDDVDGDGVNNEPDLCEFTPNVDTNDAELIRTVVNGLVQENGCMTGDTNADSCVNRQDIDGIAETAGELSIADLAKRTGYIYSNWQIGNNCNDGPATLPAAPRVPNVAGVPGFVDVNVNKNTYDLGPLFRGSRIPIDDQVNQAVAERGERYQVSLYGNPQADTIGVTKFSLRFNTDLVEVIEIVPGEGVRFSRKAFGNDGVIWLNTYLLPDTFSRERIGQPTHFADIFIEINQGVKLPEVSTDLSWNGTLSAAYDFAGNEFSSAANQVILGSSSLFTVAPTRWCEDAPDNGNFPDVSGVTTIEEPLGQDANPQLSLDACSPDGQSITEYFCDGTERSSQNHNCGGGLVCLNSQAGAACITDTDDDGIPDQAFAARQPPINADNCLNDPNADQTNTDNLNGGGDELGDACDDDDDNDTVPDAQESGSWVFVSFDGDRGTESTSRDTDLDGIEDHQDNCPVGNNDRVKQIGVGGPDTTDADNPDQTDTDGDGLGDFCDPDDDNDEILDGAEVADACRILPDCDSDTVLDKDEVAACVQDADCDDDDLTDAEEVVQGTFPRLADTDADWLKDGLEVRTGTNPLNEDTDGDGLKDGGKNGEDRDGDGVIAGDTNNNFILDVGEVWRELNPRNADSDGDGLNDPRGTDNCPLVANADQTNTDRGDDGGDACDADDDDDSFNDDVDNCPLGDGDKVLNEVGVDTNGDQTDTDVDGQGNVCDADDDNDGLTDVDEAQRRTNSLSTDSDNDRLNDKLEVDTLTNPISNDSDSDGLTDDVEDVNFSGAVDAGETDPRKADTDGDGINDALETDNGQIVDTDGDGTIDALDVDSDNDSIDDQIERVVDTDGDGIPDYRDEDSDNDGLFDGFEENGFFDGVRHDYVTITNRLSPDTDGDGLCDGAAQVAGVPVVGCQGSEDKDTDGRFEQNGNDLADFLDDETNPLVADTDGDAVNDQLDTCPSVSNADQVDTDGDATEGCNVGGFCGNACDLDDDNDGVNDVAADNSRLDNCIQVRNGPSEDNQADFDNDDAGDACDLDVDGDGVENGSDLCAFTPWVDVNGIELIRTVANELVTANGCMVGDMDADGCVNNGDVDAIVTHVERGRQGGIGADTRHLASYIGKVYTNWQVGNGCVDAGPDVVLPLDTQIDEGSSGFGALLDNNGDVINTVDADDRLVVERGQQYRLPIIGNTARESAVRQFSYIFQRGTPFDIPRNPEEIPNGIHQWYSSAFANERIFVVYTLPDYFPRARLSKPTLFAHVVFNVQQGDKLPEVQTDIRYNDIQEFDLNGEFLVAQRNFINNLQVFTVAPTRWCEDTEDGGKNPAVPGRTQSEPQLGEPDTPKQQMDICIGEDSIQEYYCYTHSIAVELGEGATGTFMNSEVERDGCNVGLVCVSVESAGGAAACITDTDDDGIPDDGTGIGYNVKDNCPLLENPDQLNTDGAADGGDACDDTPCSDNADVVAGVCTCREGFINDNAGWGDGCEAVAQVAAVDSDNDGVNDSDEPAACVGVGEQNLVAATGCYFGDDNTDGVVSSQEYTVFNAKYRRNINNLQDTISSSAYTVFKAKYRRGLIPRE